MTVKEKMIFAIMFESKKIKNIITKCEGGEPRSLTLRKFTKEKYNVDVGLYSYGCCFEPYFNMGGTVNIGKYCSFATDIHYFGANHPMNYASMSPFFYNPQFGYDVKDVNRKTLTVGNDVWCGYGVIITNKCSTIGNGAVIAAGSIITSNIPPYAVAAGSPARIIKYRFDQETISLLEESKWYDLDPDVLMGYYNVIETPVEFANKIIDYNKHIYASHNDA